MTPNNSNGQTPRAESAVPPTGPSDALRRIGTRSPQEALGLPAGTGLFKPFLVATVLTAVAFAALTVGPYYWEKSHPPAGKEGSPAAGNTPESPAPTAPSPSVAPQPSSPENGSPKSPSPPSGTPDLGKSAGKDDILGKLGESGTKVVPARVNPLDKKDDDLLKDIK